jgi:hypothetical protein
LVSDIALAGIHVQRDKFGSDCIFVAPFAREASGDNAIPQVFAEVCGMVFRSSAVQSKGGVVHGVFVLVNAGRSKSLSPDKRTIKIPEARYGHELIEIFGIAVNALIANEARYLVGFRTADAIRNRLAKAKQEIDLRLRSKGIPGVFEG